MKFLWFKLIYWLQLMDLDSIFMLIAIGLVLSISLMILFKQDRYTWYKSAPSLITTTGIFCTFMGVTIGLMRFSPENSDSLRFLLEGLKLAFIPSALAILISIGFKLLYTGSSASVKGNIFIEKLAENTAAIEKLVDAVQVVDWQIAYKNGLELNINDNAALLSVLHGSLSQLIETINNTPQQLIDSSKAFEQAISDTSSMLVQTSQDLKNTLAGLGINVKKAMTTIEQQTKQLQGPLASTHSNFNDTTQLLQQLRPLNKELVNELTILLTDKVRNLEAVITQQLQQVIAAIE